MFGLCAACSGVLPPSDSCGSSAQPSGMTMAYFMVLVSGEWWNGEWWSGGSQKFIACGLAFESPREKSQQSLTTHHSLTHHSPPSLNPPPDNTRWALPLRAVHRCQPTLFEILLPARRAS